MTGRWEAAARCGGIALLLMGQAIPADYSNLTPGGKPLDALLASAPPLVASVRTYFDSHSRATRSHADGRRAEES